MKTLVAVAITTSFLGSGCLCGPGDGAYEEEGNRYERLSYDGAEFHVYYVNLRTATISAVWKNGESVPLQTFGNALDHCRSQHIEPLFMTNAGIFMPSLRPEGLYVESGRMLVPLNRLSGDGNFYLKPNGVFFVDAGGAHVVDAALVSDAAIGSMQIATQSGPLLAAGRNIHPSFQSDSPNKKVRSGVGLQDPQHVCFVLSKDEVTFYQLAKFFVDALDCDDALYLDGVISQFYVSGNPEFQSKSDQFAAMLVVAKK